MADSVIRKPIPKTGEMLPAIGLGTWQTFDVGTTQSARAPLKEVLREFVRLGGSVVDSSPMYGRSESVTGDLAAELGVQKKLFLATKVWTSGRDTGVRQMEESFKRLRTERMDLLQVHNLVDYRYASRNPEKLERTGQSSLHRRHPLHGKRLRRARARARQRRIGFCPAQLFDRGTRSGKTPLVSGPRKTTRRARQPAARRRRAV